MQNRIVVPVLLALSRLFIGVQGLPWWSLSSEDVAKDDQNEFILEQEPHGWSRLPLTQSFKHDLIYTVEVGVGNPSQRLRLQVDIASPDTFLDGAPLMNEAHCPDGRYYRCTPEGAPTYPEKGNTPRPVIESPFSSSELKKRTTSPPASPRQRRDTTTAIEIHYGGYLAASGAVEHAVFQLGALPPVFDQTFLHAHDTPLRVQFHDPWCPVDGTLGFAPARSGEHALNASSPFLRLAESRGLDANLFALRLREPAEMTIGRVDSAYLPPTLPHGEVVVLPVRSCHAWSTIAEGVEVRRQSGGHDDEEESSFARFDLRGVRATFSTRSAGIFLPNAVFTALMAILGFEELSYLPPSVPCDRRAGMPDLVFSLDGRTLSISAFDYTLGVPATHEGEERRCLAAIKPASALGGEEKGVVLGSAFLRAYYAIFDLDARSIGLIKLPHTT